MPISQDEAHQAAQKFLDRIYSDTSMTIVLETDATEEYPWAYTVEFDSQEHIDTGEFARAPFTHVVIVPKSGDVPYLPPTDMTTAEFYEHLTVSETTPPMSTTRVFD